MAGMMPSSYMGAVMFGNGVSGIACNVLNCITLIAFPDSLYQSSFIYFILAAVVLILCIFGQLFLRSNVFVQYYIKRTLQA